MAESEGLDVLFFELASESRLSILQTLCGVSLKMQDVARKLDLTATEASRQLQKLSDAKLIERLPDGVYKTTSFGRLMLTLSSSLEFAFRHKQYFSEHDVSKLPVSFVHRFGELSGSVLVNDLNECLVKWESLVHSAEDHLWVMTPQVMPLLSRATGEKLPGRFKVKSLISENLTETSKANVTKGANVERRYLPDVSVVLLVSEKEASLSLPLFDGQMHHASFFANDKSSLEWVNELFLYYWDKAKKYP